MKKIELQLRRQTIAQISAPVVGATNSSQGGACSCEQHCEQAASRDCDSNCEWCSYSVTHEAR